MILGEGYDGLMQDLYHYTCPYVLARSVNCVIYEGSGQATPCRAGHPFITDWWSVVTPIVDYLHTRPAVDTSRIVLMGDSFGGTLAPLAASQEHLLSAMFLLDGLPNLRMALEEQFGDVLVGLYNQSLTNQSAVQEFNEAIFETLASPEIPTSFTWIWDYTFWSMKAATPFEGFTKLGNFKWGPETAAQIGELPVFVAKGQVRSFY